jgi:hypothetical protein
MTVILKILFLLFVTGSLMSCHSDALLEPELEEYSIVEGETVKTRPENKNFDILKKSKYLRGKIILGDTILNYQSVKLHDAPVKRVDIEKLKSPYRDELHQLKGEPFKLITLGGSVSAGVMDGGYFNEGIETSYPNLIARQLGLKDFISPRFDNRDYNGFGRLALSAKNYTGGPVLKFNISTNNSGIKEASENRIVLNSFRDPKSISNWSIPFSTRWEAIWNYSHSLMEYQAFSERIDYKNSSTKLGDIVIMENGFSDMISYLTGARDPNNTDFINGYGWGAAAIQEEAIAISYNTKGKDVSNRRFMFCVFNVPDVLDLALLNYIKSPDVEKSLLFGKEIVFKDYKPEELVWYPNPALDSLMGKNVNMVLKNDILKEFETGRKGIGRYPSSFFKNSQYYRSIANYNDLIQQLGKEYSFPIIDMKSMYSRIRKGEYVTHDGIKVEFKYPHGNFYSLDGIHPTAFGQAVIANEVIATLNTYYKIDIPLVPTRHYL